MNLVIYVIYLFILSVWMLSRSETLDCGPSLDDETCFMLPDIAVTREHKLLILVNQLLLF